MVGQRFVHCWSTIRGLRLSSWQPLPAAAGKTYREALGSRWAMPSPVPASMADLVMYDASDVEKIGRRPGLCVLCRGS